MYLQGASSGGICTLSPDSFICGGRHHMGYSCQLTPGPFRLPILGLGITQHLLLYSGQPGADWGSINHSARRYPTQPTPSSSAAMRSQKERWCQIVMPFLHQLGLSVQWQTTVVNNQEHRVCIAGAAKRATVKMKFYPQEQAKTWIYPLPLVLMCGEEEEHILKQKITVCISPQNCWGLFFCNFTNHFFRHNLNTENFSPNIAILKKAHALQNSW